MTEQPKITESKTVATFGPAISTSDAVNLWIELSQARRNRTFASVKKQPEDELYEILLGQLVKEARFQGGVEIQNDSAN